MSDEPKSVHASHRIVCPSCGRDDDIHIWAERSVKLLPDGLIEEDPEEGYDWHRESPTFCYACDYSDFVSEFQAAATQEAVDD
jgi:hypothetical protein